MEKEKKAAKEVAENPTVCAQVALLAPPQLELASQFLCYMMMMVMMILMMMIKKLSPTTPGTSLGSGGIPLLSTKLFPATINNLCKNPITGL